MSSGNKFFIDGFEIAGNDINTNTLLYRYSIAIEFDTVDHYDNSIQTLITNASKINRNISISGYSKPDDLMSVSVENVGDIWATTERKIRGKIYVTVKWVS